MHTAIIALSLQAMKDWPSATKGFFIAGAGLLGVFLVLVLFYVAVRLLERAFRVQEPPQAIGDSSGLADDES